ncbi:MAG: hypothetical protein LBR80_03235 [Deltaproteobacteria bacterium]|nr:hypothetical protein [Deltaproteobacteria bacterium]
MPSFTENLGRAPGCPACPELPLDSASRRRPRQRARLSDGREAGIMLSRGTVMAPGDVLRDSGGELARVTAASEPLSEARAGNGEQLALVAYHLGNRHAEIELGPLLVRFPEDPVLEDLARRLGLPVSRLSAPFLPEGGAYGGHFAAHGPGQGTADDRGRRHEPSRRHGSGASGVHVTAGDPGQAGSRDCPDTGDAEPRHSRERGLAEADGRDGVRRGVCGAFASGGAHSLRAADRLVRLLYAASPARPTGTFAWSGGLASYMASGEVKDAGDLSSWIGDAISLTLARCDLPLLHRCFLAAVRRDAEGFRSWNGVSLASRGTSELLLGERETGAAVMRMLDAAGLLDGFTEGFREGPVGYVAAYGLMGAALGLGEGEAVDLACAFLWGAAENLALCAAKSVPLGQGAIQGVMLGLMAVIPQAAEEALRVADGELGASAPLLAVRSCGHESSPLRMYRS